MKTYLDSKTSQFSIALPGDFYIFRFNYFNSYYLFNIFPLTFIKNYYISNIALDYLIK